MVKHTELTGNELKRLIKNKAVVLGGNNRLKIYGLLNCKSGKRMKKGNRVFFGSADEAQNLGFRPCGHCLNNEYKEWKNGYIQQ